jgi:hypothetical protein
LKINPITLYITKDMDLSLTLIEWNLLKKLKIEELHNGLALNVNFINDSGSLDLG